MSEKKNDELAKSVVGFLDKYGEKLWNGVKTISGKAKEQTTLDWRLGYETYLNNVFEKYSYAKPFLSGNFPRLLDDFYIPLAVSCGKDVIDETSIEDLTLTNKFSIIVANAGSGKTMLMRHLVVDTIKNKKVSHLPVFVELRELNNKDLSLFDLIKKKLRDNGFNFDDNYIEMAFKAGHFALFFDGFDEVAYVIREQVNEQIQELADKYNNNYFVLSSRPDDSLYRWTLFDVWQVEPLNLEQACKLVEKTNEDEQLKDKFTKALQEKLFETHKSFLSNPLLLSIMLITYKDSANIPQKLSTFYERAYIALFERHDATKGAFSREKLSKLDIIDFKKVFSAFCFLTYRKTKYGDFSETEIYDFLDKAIKLSGIIVDRKSFIEDAIQAACLLVRDGLNITFSHRSFQEYFSAVFIAQIGNEEKRNKLLIEQVVYFEDFLDEEPFWLTLFEIAPYTIELLIIKALDKLFCGFNFSPKYLKDEYRRFLQTYFSDFRITDVSNSEKPYTSMTWQDGSYENWQIGCLNLSIECFLTNEEREKFAHNSKFLKLYRSKAMRTVNIETFTSDKELFEAFCNEPYWNNLKHYKRLFDLKNQLIEKHCQQEALLNEDFD